MKLSLVLKPSPRHAMHSNNWLKNSSLPPARFLGWSALRKLCSSAKQVADPDYGVATLERGLGGTGGRGGARGVSKGNLSPEFVGKSVEGQAVSPPNAVPHIIFYRYANRLGNSKPLNLKPEFPP